jgi:hypothetical protein
MAFLVTPYHQICVKKMNIYSGEFFLGNAHCLNPDSQDLGIFPINSEKKQRILHNFAEFLAKNIKTPSKSTKASSKNIGALIKNIGIIVRTMIMQQYMHNVGVRFIAPNGVAWQDTPSGVSNACHPFPFHAKGNINNFTLTPNKENHNEKQTH